MVDLLSEHWAIFGPGCKYPLFQFACYLFRVADLYRHRANNADIDSTSTTFQPFFLNFYRVHALATHFFIRMWNESGATRGDFSRVAALVRSQWVSSPRRHDADRTQPLMLGSRPRSKKKTCDRGTKSKRNSTMSSTTRFEIAKCESWKWRTTSWASFPCGESSGLEMDTYGLTTHCSLAIFAQSCIKSHTNSCDNNEYTVSCRVLGL